MGKPTISSRGWGWKELLIEILFLLWIEETIKPIQKT